MPRPRVSDALTNGLTAHRAGRLSEARRHYEEAIRQSPRQADAWQLLGIAAAAQGDNPRALSAFREVVALQPDSPEAAFNLGLLLQEQGQHGEAIGCFRNAVRLRPNYSDASYGLGLSLEKGGDGRAAASAYAAAARIDPARISALFDLGNALRDGGDLAGAIAAYREAIAIKPAYVEALCHLGNALKATGQAAQAADAYRTALAHDSKSAVLLNNLGIVLQEQGSIDEAVATFHRAIVVDPRYVEAHNSLAPALQRLNRLDEAIAACRRALELDPSLGAAWSNLGNAYLALNRLPEAIEAFAQAVRLSPRDSFFLKNLGHAYLASGRLGEGWPLYEERWNTDLPEQRRRFSQPRWTGAEPIDGRTILLHAEQGLGDTIQFARFAEPLAQRGAKVILEVQPPLKELLAPLAGASLVLAQGEHLPPFDLYCPLLSVPLGLGTELASIPRSIPYLRAHPEKSAAWRDRFPADQASPRIGIVWSGQAQHKNDHNRSLPLTLLQPLVRGSGARFICLQNEIRTADQPLLREMPEIATVCSGLRSFSDTAALLDNMDVVIAVDTSIAHLAGAMGKPVWILLPFAADWRWLAAREDSPWYPTARLFRQPAVGDWGPVIARLRAAIDQL